MSKPSPVFDSYSYMSNEDGSITGYPTRFKDIIVKDNSTWMRLHVPMHGYVSSKKLPLVVYYHAGGLIMKNVVKLFHDFCSLMARELNAVVACPSYQLAPDRLPAAYDNGVEALEWLRNSSEDDVWIKSHVELSNVYLMGSNAGGNVAYNVGLISTARDLTPLSIRGLILHRPFFGGEERCESELRYVNDRALTLPVADSFWDICLPVGANRDHEYSNPTVGNGPDNMEKIGRLGWKVMVSGGEGDPVIDRQRSVAKLMKEKGVDVVERFTEGDVYKDELRCSSESRTLLASIRNFIASSAP